MTTSIEELFAPLEVQDIANFSLEPVGDEWSIRVQLRARPLVEGLDPIYRVVARRLSGDEKTQVDNLLAAIVFGSAEKLQLLSVASSAQRPVAPSAAGLP